MAPAADRTRVAVLISGAGTNMAALLYASRLPGAPYEIVLVASNDPDAAGLRLAEAEGVPTFARSHKGMARADFDAILDAELKKARADTVALAGYMRLLSPGFVAKWRGRLLNIHPSLLPLYPGLDTHARAIEAGDGDGGASVHLVTDAVDAGEVLGSIAVSIRPGETPETLAERVKFAEHQLYPRVLADFFSRWRDPDAIVARVGDLALALPETHARASHGAPGWRVGSESSGKFFAYVSIRHHGDDAVALLAKTSGPDEMAALIDAEPDLYYRPQYYGASGWIALRLDRPDTDWDNVAHWLERSWRSVAPARLTRFLDTADDF